MIVTISHLEEAFSSFKKKRIKKNKIQIFNSNDYFLYVLNYEGKEITPDLILLDYQLAITENTYIQENFDSISKKYWLFVTSGQGDHWFIEKTNGLIAFYDHDYGEYNNKGFIFFDINFFQFMQMALLLSDIENIQQHRCLTKSEINNIILTLNGISTRLYDKYPFEIF